MAFLCSKIKAKKSRTQRKRGNFQKLFSYNKARLAPGIFFVGIFFQSILKKLRISLLSLIFYRDPSKFFFPQKKI